MKKMICLLLSVMPIFGTITACSLQAETVSNDGTTSTESTSEPTTTTTTMTELSTTPVSELGFYHLEEMGNYLIEIDEYNINNSSGDYVCVDVNSNALKIENGYIQYYDIINSENSTIEMNLSSAYPCTIVNNDYIDIPGGNSSSTSINISDRITSESRDDFVVLVDEGSLSRSETWYIPYNLIDWDKDVEKFEEEDKRFGGTRTRYKLFLK